MIKKIFQQLHNFTVWGKDSEEWCVAIKTRTELEPLNENYNGFKLIKNTFRYWYADPFLFEHNGKEYLFLEMYDRIKRKADLGVAIIKNGKVGKIKKCLSEDFHLSYPCVFEKNAEIFMIPESYQAGETYIYKAKIFPYVWEKSEVLFTKIAADTTPIPGSSLFLSTIFQNEYSRKSDNLYLYSKENKTTSLVYSNYLKSRCGGYIFLSGKKLFRPSQNCKVCYGGSLVINEIKTVSENSFKEESIKEIFPVDIQLIKKRNQKYVGIHTLNFSQNHMVVDLSYRGISLFHRFVINIFAYIEEKIKKEK